MVAESISGAVAACRHAGGIVQGTLSAQYTCQQQNEAEGATLAAASQGTTACWGYKQLVRLSPLEALVLLRLCVTFLGLPPLLVAGSGS